MLARQCRFLFRKKAGGTSFARPRKTAPRTSAPPGSGCGRAPTGISAISSPSVLIPSLFTKRAGDHVRPHFPKIRKGEICITWIGHASFLIQTHEVNVLIDPIWSKWLKVIKRLKQPGFEIHHLPEIDFVLVTHAHFDHLDRRTLRKVAADQPIVVPIGVGNLVHDLGFNIVHELDYWQTRETRSDRGFADAL